MGNIIGLDLNLDESYLQSSVEEIVKAGIVKSLGDPYKIVKMAIDQTLNKKVDEKGNPTNYHGTPYLDWLAADTIEKVVRKSMEDAVQKNLAEFEGEIKKQILSKKFSSKIASAFLDAVLASSAHCWRMPINVSFEEKD